MSSIAPRFEQIALRELGGVEAKLDGERINDVHGFLRSIRQHRVGVGRQRRDDVTPWQRRRVLLVIALRRADRRHKSVVLEQVLNGLGPGGEQTGEFSLFLLAAAPQAKRFGHDVASPIVCLWVLRAFLRGYCFLDLIPVLDPSELTI
jgi:hypothetical protein